MLLSHLPSAANASFGTFGHNPSVSNHDSRFTVMRLQPSLGFLKTGGIHSLTGRCSHLPVLTRPNGLSGCSSKAEHDNQQGQYESTTHN